MSHHITNPNDTVKTIKANCSLFQQRAPAADPRFLKGKGWMNCGGQTVAKHRATASCLERGRLPHLRPLPPPPPLKSATGGRYYIRSMYLFFHLREVASQASDYVTEGGHFRWFISADSHSATQTLCKLGFSCWAKFVYVWSEMAPKLEKTLNLILYVFWAIVCGIISIRLAFACMRAERKVKSRVYFTHARRDT